MALDISAVICTHNPRTEYLRRTLEGLERQTLAGDRWEVLLVDNASTEPLAAKWDLSRLPNARHVLEPTLGLTPARLRGIDEARGNVIVFVDDDNVLAPNFLEECLRIEQKWPSIGVWGGAIVPEFENGPPPEQWKIEYWTAKVDRDIWSNDYDMKATPIGAGICVRREVADQYAKVTRDDPVRLSLDRKGAESEAVILGACGDIDMAHVACDMSLGTGRFKALELIHLVPVSRLDDEYIRVRYYGGGYFDVLRGMVRGKLPPYRPILDRVLSYGRLLRFPRSEWRWHVAYDEGRVRALRDMNRKK